ncbi:MAG: hypothetical protein DKINENOH_00729 [bacterium]|nr:hypothetical protein [bacterium]
MMAVSRGCAARDPRFCCGTPAAYLLKWLRASQMRHLHFEKELSRLTAAKMRSPLPHELANAADQEIPGNDDGSAGTRIRSGENHSFWLSRLGNAASAQRCRYSRYCKIRRCAANAAGGVRLSLFARSWNSCGSHCQHEPGAGALSFCAGFIDSKNPGKGEGSLWMIQRPNSYNRGSPRRETTWVLLAGLPAIPNRILILRFIIANKRLRRRQKDFWFVTILNSRKTTISQSWSICVKESIHPFNSLMMLPQHSPPMQLDTVIQMSF